MARLLSENHGSPGSGVPMPVSLHGPGWPWFVQFPRPPHRRGGSWLRSGTERTLIPCPRSRFVNTKQEIEVEAGANLRQAAMKAGVAVYKGLDRFLTAAASGLCGTCRVLVKSGMENLTSKTLLEKLNSPSIPFPSWPASATKRRSGWRARSTSRAIAPSRRRPPSTGVARTSGKNLTPTSDSRPAAAA